MLVSLIEMLIVQSLPVAVHLMLEVKVVSDYFLPLLDSYVKLGLSFHHSLFS